MTNAKEQSIEEYLPDESLRDAQLNRGLTYSRPMLGREFETQEKREWWE